MARFESSPYPVESILQELRAVDGELFRSEVVQRMYLILKTQVLESIYSVWAASRSRTGRSPHRIDVYSKALQAFQNWTRSVRDEEMQTLSTKHADIEELWKEVSMIYVRLCHKYTDAKTVRIKAPVVEELLQNFFQHIVKSSWCQTGDLWSYDHVKLDFTLREFFRRAVMDSVHIVRVTQEKQPKTSPAPKKSAVVAAPPPEEDEEIYPDDSISTFFDESSKGRAGSPRRARSAPAKPHAVAADSDTFDSATVIGNYKQQHDSATVIGAAQQFANHDAATVAKNEHGGDFDSATVIGAPQHNLDSTTVIYKPTRWDSATVARPSDMQSTCSSTSSGSSRFSKLTAPKLVSLQTSPSLPVIEEVKRVQISELPSAEEDDSEDDAPLIKVQLSGSE